MDFQFFEIQFFEKTMKKASKEASKEAQKSIKRCPNDAMY
jgi:hypothetical protein